MPTTTTEMMLETVLGQRRGEGALGADHVVVEPGDERAGLGAGEERERLALHVAEDLGAQVVDQPLADPGGEPAARPDRSTALDDRDDRHRERPATTTSAVSPPRMPSSMIALEQQRRHDDQRGVDDGDHEEDRDQPPVRAGEAEHPAHGPALDPVVDDAAVGAQVPPRRPRPGMPCIPDHRRTPAVLQCSGWLRRQLQGRASSRKRRTCASRSRRRCSSRSRSAAPCSSALVSATAPGHRCGQGGRRGRRRSASSSSAGTAVSGEPDVARPPRRRPSGRSRRSPAPWRSQRSRPAALFRSGRAPGRARTPSCENCASSATTRRSQDERELEAGADGVAVHRGDRDEARVAQPGEAALEAVDRGPRPPRRDCASSADHRALARRCSGRASPRSRPAEKVSPCAPSPPRRGRRRAALRRCSPSACHIAGVWALRTSGRSSVTVATGPATSKRRPTAASVFGSHAAQVLLASNPRRARPQASDTRSA